MIKDVKCFDDIHDNIKVLVKEYPDFKYTSQNFNKCFYGKGGDEKYPQLKGCIIGQACPNLELEDGEIASEAVAKYIDLVEEQSFFLNSIQVCQDNRMSWSKSYETAFVLHS